MGLWHAAGWQRTSFGFALLTVVQPPPLQIPLLLVSQVHDGVLGPLSLVLIHSISSLGQDKLELELALKGSYEDTQTFALDTASTFSFHYVRGQDTELTGCLRVSLLSTPHYPGL